MMYDTFEELCKENGMTPYRVSKLTGIGRSTFSDWKNGRSTPKADKLQKIADLFGVSIEVFYKDSVQNNGQEESYYLDDEMKELVDFAKNNPEHRTLFEASRKLNKDDLHFIMDMIERFSD